jgi:starch synthase
LESHYQKNGYHRDVHSLITVHNLKYQGIHGCEVVQDLLDLTDDYMTDDKVLLNGVPNFMKAGITYASRVTTVSPTYAREIMTDYYGEGLDGVLRDQGWKVQGILNGIDIGLYNPEKDPALPASYSKKAWVRGKGRCKAALQQEAGLPQKPKTPLISMVTRLAQQKGIDLLVRILDELLEEDVQFILLGSGDPNYERRIREIEARHPDRMRAYIMFDPLLARRIYAGSDIFLMPSLFEPCGLSQMIAMRYGTLPIVRQTGGLADTVQAYNRYDHTGNGFGFLNINAHELLFTTKDAVKLYNEEPVIWKKLVHQAMAGDYSWDRSAQSYEQLYRDILEETR